MRGARCGCMEHGAEAAPACRILFYVSGAERVKKIPLWRNMEKGARNRSTCRRAAKQVKLKTAAYPAAIDQNDTYVRYDIKPHTI